MTKILVPPTYAESSDKTRTIFLAGPIQGVTPWQDKAIAMLDTNSSDYKIANPRRSDKTWEFQFDIQVDWETHHLNTSSENGVILFFLAKETEHDCNRSYAQTTRFELGEWVRAHRDGYCPNLVIGFEEGFTGARYIKRRLATDPRLRTIVAVDGLGKACAMAFGLATMTFKDKEGNRIL